MASSGSFFGRDFLGECTQRIKLFQDVPKLGAEKRTKNSPFSHKLSSSEAFGPGPSFARCTGELCGGLVKLQLGRSPSKKGERAPVPQVHKSDLPVCFPFLAGEALDSSGTFEVPPPNQAAQMFLGGFSTRSCCRPSSQFFHPAAFSKGRPLARPQRRCF